MDNTMITIIVSLSLFLVFLLIVGYVSSKKTKSTADFALASRNMGPLIVAATIIATYGSASSFLGNPGLAYEYGWSMTWIWVGCLIGIVIPILFFGPRMRMISVRLNTLTVPDFLGEIYESRFLQLIMSLGILIFYTPMMVAQFKGVGVLFSAFFGTSFDWPIIVLGAVLIIFSSKGGFVTVAWTDAAQSIFMAVLMIFIVPASIYMVGGWGAMNERLTTIDSTLTGIFDPVMFTPITVIFMLIYYSLWQIGQPYMSIRLFALNDVKSFRKVVIYVILFTVIISGGMWAGYAGRILFPNLDQADAVLPVFVSTYFPTYIGALVVIGVLSAVLTTVSSILHSVGTTVGYDLIQKCFGMKLTDRQSLRISQISTLIIGSIAIVGSLVRTPEFLSILVYGALGGMGSLVVGPIIMAVFDKKATKEGAIVASLLGVVAFSILLLNSNVWIAGSIGMVISIIGTYVFSRIFGSPSRKLKMIHENFNTAEKKAI
ncbi:sodium:solute symporter family protein [Oceanobacillus senegalensis]|uniref:sodium:solute symporter family protein n=1 Tax=Oceanobacillus senegalensis TaxID=1936063 RepID=UPI000A30D3FF|nr:hypothetical protein [Oceanobacillus senegalensis]